MEAKGLYVYDPIMPPNDPAELCNAIPTARFVGELGPILFAFHAIVIAMPGKAPIAAKNVPTYLAPGVLVVSKTMKPTTAIKKLKALTYPRRLYLSEM